MYINTFIKKADIVLAAVLLLLGVGSLFLLRSPADQNALVEISVDGKTIGSYALSKDKELDIESEYGFNRVVIKSNEVWIDEADCKGGDCLSFGHIKNTGEVIICAPHRLLVTITGGGEDGDVDLGAY